MKCLFTILLFILITISYNSLAQATAQYDGIVIAPSSVNDAVFYYGEPIYLYFSVSNEKSAINPYYIPQRNVNVQLTLLNRETGKLLGEEGWTQVSHRRDQFQHQSLGNKDAFQPKERVLFQIYLNDEFGTVKLAEPQYYNALANRLRTLLAGKYELTMKYFLFPTDQVLSSNASFEIRPSEPSHQEALGQYIKSTTYACNAHYLGGNNYQSGHRDSYENFLQRYSDSPYAPYAFVDMVTQSYSHQGVPASLRTEKFNSYFNHFPEISNGGLKMYYAVHLPGVVKHLPGKDIRDSLDEFLKTELIDENPDISSALIDAAKFYTGTENLKNYAKEAIPK